MKKKTIKESCVWEHLDGKQYRTSCRKTVDEHKHKHVVHCPYCTGRAYFFKGKLVNMNTEQLHEVV